MSSHFKQMASYLFVGGTAVALYYVLVYVLYQRLHAHYLVAVSFAYAASVTLHFTANRSITFAAASADMKSALIKYALLAGLNYLVALGVVAIAVQHLSLNVYIGSTMAILVTMVIGYLGMKYWVFGGYKAIRA
jgi:putative flippase GtrA